MPGQAGERPVRMTCPENLRWTIVLFAVSRNMNCKIRFGSGYLAQRLAFARHSKDPYLLQHTIIFLGIMLTTENLVCILSLPIH